MIFCVQYCTLTFWFPFHLKGVYREVINFNGYLTRVDRDRNFTMLTENKHMERIKYIIIFNEI